MATPLKQWEMNARTPLSQSNSSRSGVNSSVPTSTSSTAPPTLPPRTANSYSSTYPPSYGSGFGGVGGYGTGVGGYGTGYSGYGTGVGGYGTGVGGYGTGYSGLGYRPYGGMYGGGGGFGLGGMYGDESSQFMRQAEETTRAAFSSVGSVVGAVSSVSMMLESTYFAVHSCFRAVLGVAQHFTRLKNQVWDILAAIAVLRRLQQWLRYLLRLFRLRRHSEGEDAWDEVSLAQESSLRLAHAGHTAPGGNARVWPAVIFFAIVFGVPWLLWKLLSAIARHEETTQQENPPQEQQWSGDNGDQPLVAKALYDFTASRSDELSFAAGDELVLAPRQLQTGGDWLLVGRNRRSGMVPRTYVQVVRSSTSSPGTNQTSGQQLLQDEQNLSND
ncbi:peroxisomal membrane protein PEX13-like [Halichondria panicea]|uniref:peroxisomal membrane protein PEX13-like n=1 Tax=Halichondria panicea TaxID=6063 RepID=UPI00312B4CDE